MTYGIIAVTKKNPEDVIFFAKFSEIPDASAYMDLYKLLESDERYGLVGQKFYLLPASETDIATIESMIEMEKADDEQG